MSAHSSDRAKQTDVDSPVLASVLESNQRHIGRAIKMIEAAGNRRVGVIGLSFKAGTDDVRESPAVALIETLVGRGYTVSVYDELVDPNRLVGANKACLERELPHIANLMRDSVDEVPDETETIVLANGGGDTSSAVERLRHDHHVVDLVGAANGQPLERYDGICW